MSKVLLSDSFTSPGVFLYDPARPTYYSELYAHSLHTYQAALAAAGAADEIEPTDSASSLALIESYSNELSTWIESAFDTFSAFQASDSENVPALPSLPLLPDLLGKAILLFPGGKLLLFLKVAVTLLRVFLNTRNALKTADAAAAIKKGLLTKNCSGDVVGLADMLRASLSRCNQSELETVQDSIDSLRDMLGGVVLELETEKAARIRLGYGVDAEEIPVQP